MERLTRREEGIAHYPYCFKEETCDGLGASSKCDDCNFSTAVCEKLADYEDLEEQGLLLKLPCKVGTTYYTFDIQYWIDEKECKGCLNYYDCEIETFCENDDDYPKCMQVVKRVFSNNSQIVSNMNCFGKTVFLTKEEAEAKLKELENV